jgi:hypothetical protein
MFNGTTYMKIQGSTGNVGIGTANPALNLDNYYNSARIAGTTQHYVSATSTNTTTYIYIGRFTTYGTVTVNFTASGSSSFSANYATFTRQFNDKPTVAYLLNGDNYTTHHFYYQSVDFYSYDVWHRQDNLTNLAMRFHVSGPSIGRPTEPSSPTLTECAYGHRAKQWPGGGLAYNTFDGSVGIGTNAPAEKLHVVLTGNASVRVESPLNPSIAFVNTEGGVGNTKFGQISYKHGNRGDADQALQFHNPDCTGSNLAFSFLTSGAVTRAVILNDGRVGIGTASPREALEVYGGFMGTANSTLYSHNLYYDTQWKYAEAGYGGATMRMLDSEVQFWNAPNNNASANSAATLTQRFTITENGNVGIGTATPIAKFHVNGVDGRIWGLPVRSFDDTYALTYNATAYYADPAVSIWASGKIFAGDLIGSVGGTITASDERIKTNITDINDGDALATLRLLKPKKYQYKDTIKRGTEYVWGFIAQEVANTLSYSTQTTINTLPNIYEMANVSDSNVITFTNFDTSILESNASVIKVNARDGTDHLVKLVEVINDHTIRVEEDLSAWTGSVDETGNIITEITTTTLSPEEYETLEDKSGYVANITGYQNANVVVSIEEYNALEDTTGYEEIVQDYIKTTTTYPGTQLFIYGQEVDDFVFLKKDAIWTVATAALQEVDRQLQAEKEKVATLESQLTSVLARLDALESV